MCGKGRCYTCEVDAKLTPAGILAAARVADFSVLAAFMLKGVGMSELPTSDYPVWVGRAADKVSRALFPKVYEVVAPDTLRKAYVTGLTFGLMEAGQKGMRSLAAKLPEGMPEPTEEQIAAAWRWLYREDADKVNPPSNGELIATEYRAQFRQIESEMNEAELAGLHQGITDAARMLLGENASTATTATYRTMVIYWRVVEHFPNSEALFDWLTKGLGAGVVGTDPKRIAQLCRRVGKTFPRRPGRPRKTTST